MPECKNCGSHVSEAYARVFSLRGEDTVRYCLHCKDRTYHHSSFAGEEGSVSRGTRV